MSTSVTRFYWSSSNVYFNVDQCVFEDGKDLLGLMIRGEIVLVAPSDRQDCYSYQVAIDSNAYFFDSTQSGNIATEIFWPEELYDTPLERPILLPAPVNVNLFPPVLLEGTGSPSYEIVFNWDYFSLGQVASTNTVFYWYEVEWNRRVYPVGPNLETKQYFSEPGPVAARVRAAGTCANISSSVSCRPKVNGVDYTVIGGPLFSKWSKLQSVVIPIADTQFPTNTGAAAAPAAVVDALVGVSDAFGQPLSEPRAHLWSIFICLLLAIGLAAVCVGATGGGPASIFLGALAFFLVFSLAGPTAFGVPGVFAGLALLVPGLGLALYAKGKVR